MQSPQSDLTPWTLTLSQKLNGLIFDQLKKKEIKKSKELSSERTKIQKFKSLLIKVEKILKCKLDSIPSPLRNFVIEGVACQPPLRRLQATPPLQTSLAYNRFLLKMFTIVILPKFMTSKIEFKIQRAYKTPF